MHTELVIAKGVTALLGLAIAVQAYRGGRRHGSRPMVVLAGGFVLISVGAVLEGVFVDLAGWTIRDAGLAQAALVSLGMLFVLYSLYGGSLE